jgi:PIN domain nuclease of toxin-antitoxin system
VRLLLDTHIWRWSLAAPEKLGKRLRAALARRGTELWLSPVSVWELLVLAERGRIKLAPEPRQWIAMALGNTPASEAPLTYQVAIRSREVLPAHEDPADRFLVATALVYDLTLATADEALIRARPCAILPNR